MQANKLKDVLPMMKISLMNSVVATLGADYRSPIGEAIGAAWFLDPGSLEYWRASANFVFRATRNGERCFLRFNHVEERPLDVLNAEIAMLNSLASAGVPVAAPLLSESGNYIETCDTELGVFHAVLFKGLTGKHIDLDEMSPELIAAWGASLGILHNAMSELSGDMVSGRPSWVTLLEFTENHISPDERALHAELELVRLALSELPQTPHNYGLIHFDFESDNLVWDDDDGVAALDFDDSAYLWFAADIAYALRDIFKGKTIDLTEPRFRLFVEGYRQVRQIQDAELQQLPLFVRLHRLFFIARLRHSVDIVPGGDAADWALRLCERFSRGIEQYISDIICGDVVCH